MKRRLKNLAVLALSATLIAGLCACHPEADFVAGEPNGSDLGVDSPWVEMEEKQPDLGVADENQSGPELPLAIEIKREATSIQLGPFFGPVPELSWSPDGRYLAIAGEKNGYGLWLWDQKAQSCRRLVHLLDRSGQRNTSLACFGWNAAGTALLYAVDGIQGEGQYLGRNGALIRQLGVDGTDRALAWLPGRGPSIRSYIFNQEDDLLLLHRGRDLWAVDIANQRQRQLKSDLPTWDGLFSVTLSPSARRVVYPDPDSSNKKLILLDLESGKETPLGLAGEYPFCPVWSPDGDKLAFLSARATAEGYDFQLGEDGPLPPATRVAVVSKDGRLIMKVTPPRGEKAGAPVWSPGSDKVAFLTGSIDPGPGEFMKINWHRLLTTDLKGRVQDLGFLSGDWLIIGGFAPDGSSILVFAYETKGDVLALLQSESKKLVLADDAVDEPPTWWRQNLILSRIVFDEDDYLSTQLYLSDFSGNKTRLTWGSGWKSGVQISPQGYLSYINADNQNYPYPLLVTIQPLLK